MVQYGEKISPLCSPVPSVVAPPQQSIGVVMGPEQSGRTGLGAARDDSMRKCSLAECVAAAVLWLQGRGAAN